MKLLLYYDTRTWGHHPMYVCLYTEALLKAGNLVVVVCGDPEQTLRWIRSNLTSDYVRRALIIGAFITETSLKKVGLLSFFFPFAKFFLFFVNLFFVIRKSELYFKRRIDLLFFGMADNILSNLSAVLVLDYFFKRNWTGLLVFPDALLNRLKNFMFLRKRLVSSKNLRYLFCLCENKISRLSQAIQKPFYLCPDLSCSFSKDRLKPLNKCFFPAKKENA